MSQPRAFSECDRCGVITTQSWSSGGRSKQRIQFLWGLCIGVIISAGGSRCVEGSATVVLRGRRCGKLVKECRKCTLQWFCLTLILKEFTSASQGYSLSAVPSHAVN
ncbi:hypothetical protein K449DRAFT_49894 [Hypoxylon sp. EC38]|nr:hypothetical protein K449DRAFT_49894 [Hypoxylon sp. EC38]